MFGLGFQIWVDWSQYITLWSLVQLFILIKSAIQRVIFPLMSAASPLQKQRHVLVNVSIYVIWFVLQWMRHPPSLRDCCGNCLQHPHWRHEQHWCLWSYTVSSELLDRLPWNVVIVTLSETLSNHNHSFCFNAFKMSDVTFCVTLITEECMSVTLQVQEGEGLFLLFVFIYTVFKIKTTFLECVSNSEWLYCFPCLL